MKTKHILLTVLILISAFGCGKGSGNKPTPPPAKTYLLQTISVSNSSGDTPIILYQFTYDDENRIIQSLYGLKTTLTQANASTYLKYTYDSNGNLSTTGDYTTTGTLGYSSKYTYTADSVDVTTYSSTGAVINSYGFALTDNKITAANYGSLGRYTYQYDSSGNNISFNLGGSDIYTYTYDQKKNPFSMIGGNHPQVVYFLIANAFIFYEDNFGSESNVNNVLNNQLDDITNVYTYNSAGFPTSSLLSITSTFTYRHYFYTYIIK